MKRGMLIKVQNDLFRVLDLQHFTPGNKRAILDERQMQYLYRDGDAFHFMNTENYEQLHIDIEILGDNANYLVPESTILVEFYGEEPVGIELPVTVDLKVVDTVPGINRATASAQVKPATLETGLVVQVPPFISVGDTLRISTESGEYLKKV
jgi:elongation factor P